MSKDKKRYVDVDILLDWLKRYRFNVTKDDIIYHVSNMPLVEIEEDNSRGCNGKKLKLIDRDSLYKLISTFAGERKREGIYIIQNAVLSAIKNAPVVDCEKCIFYKLWERENSITEGE